MSKPSLFWDDKSRREALRLLDQIHLSRAIASRKCGELSGGQKQRVNLARALAAEPDLILCDEITVFYAGRNVETGNRSSFSAPPFHPYTNLLISSVPEMRQGWLEDTRNRDSGAGIFGHVSGHDAAGDLCCFLGSSPVAREGLCTLQPPEIIRLSGGSEIYCHLSEEELHQSQKGGRG